LPATLAKGKIAEATITPGDAAHLAQLLPLVSGSDAPLAGVVYLWPLDLGVVAPNATAAEDWNRSRLLASHTPLQLFQQLGRLSGTLPRLWLATGGAQTAGELAAVAVTQAPLVGLVRVAAVEQVELRPTLVDFDPASDATTRAAELVAELSHPSGIDSQIAYRDGKRFVARLEGDTTARGKVELADAG